MARVDLERSAGSKRIGRIRKAGKHPICPICHRAVFVQGIKHGGRTYHSECYSRVRYPIRKRRKVVSKVGLKKPKVAPPKRVSAVPKAKIRKPKVAEFPHPPKPKVAEFPHPPKPK